jgi:hypothetical protein
MSKMMTALVMSLLVSGSAWAQSEDWNEKHPRRAQVNQRVENQRDRVADGVAKGQLTKKEANEIRGKESNVRQQERDMARLNGGRITRGEQRTLNQEENKVSRQIHRERHDNEKVPARESRETRRR